mmetsp:Transcript_26718/g.86513  ORF Transcript_26718/g.86513 Transcript_26718/m.86513 type:complete len:229 (+) Transcript_26718:78-764(+)
MPPHCPAFTVHGRTVNEELWADQRRGQMETLPCRPVFKHPSYIMSEDGKLIRKPGSTRITSSDEQNAEAASVIEALTEYVQGHIRGLGLLEHWIPDADDHARCNIFVSNIDTADKLLVILQNQVGSKPGIWSRSLCLSSGLAVGSMLDAIERALDLGYAVAVLNPNTNSVSLPGHKTRIPIANSFSPEVPWTSASAVTQTVVESCFACLGYVHSAGCKPQVNFSPDLR